ncbi:MAG: site-2 protease family protein, partial [Planctomycetota bacterium]
DVFVHWTFTLLLGYVAFSQVAAGGQVLHVLFTLLVVISIYGCITLHEFGHILAARMFGIATQNVTLLPIGGVARLERMPRKPIQEFVVAVAGPLVNVVIALTIALVFLMLRIDIISVIPEALQAVLNPQDISEAMQATDPGAAEEAARGASQMATAESDVPTVPGVADFFFTLFLANTVLVIFNMLPGFPMDGGRVLRSLLAMVMNYRSATWWALRIGVGTMLLLAWWAISIGNPLPILVAGFICYVGFLEARNVDMTEGVAGFQVADGMVRDVQPLLHSDPLPLMVAQFQQHPLTMLPVVDHDQFFLGFVFIEDIIRATQSGNGSKFTAGGLAHSDRCPLAPEDALADAFKVLGMQPGTLAVVDP